MRVTLIHNPGAGDEAHGADVLRRLVMAAGHELVYQSSDDRNWERILDEPADLVAIAGGDGTVGRVAQRMVARGVPITALPLGTANNISRSFGLADAPIEELIAGWETARRIRLDAGLATGPWGSRYFIEGVGVGLFADGLPDAESDTRLARLSAAEDRVARGLHLLKKRLPRHEPQRLSATLDGQDISGDYLLFAAMNTRFVGPNLYLAPHTEHGDGMLDFVLVTPAEREILYEYICNWQEGKLWPAAIPTIKGRCLQLEWTGYTLHMDDELWPDPGQDERLAPEAPAAIDIQVVPDALEFLA